MPRDLEENDIDMAPEGYEEDDIADLDPEDADAVNEASELLADDIDSEATYTELDADDLDSEESESETSDVSPEDDLDEDLFV